MPGAWDALVAAQKAGKIRSIGMSNMSPKYWQKFIPDFAVRTAVNQVEFNPYFQQPLRQLMAETNTMLEAWAPLGQGDPQLFSEPAITKLATKYNKDAGQIILRFDYQMDAIIFLKSVHENRIASNQHIFDFALTKAEMASLKALDKVTAATILMYQASRNTCFTLSTSTPTIDPYPRLRSMSADFVWLQIYPLWYIVELYLWGYLNSPQYLKGAHLTCPTSILIL